MPSRFIQVLFDSVNFTYNLSSVYCIFRSLNYIQRQYEWFLEFNTEDGYGKANTYLEGASKEQATDYNNNCIHVVKLLLPVLYQSVVYVANSLIEGAPLYRLFR